MTYTDSLTGSRRNAGSSRPGYADLHNAVDDHSRLAYSEILGDERKETAAGFWLRANKFFASCGITVSRVLTANGSCYRSVALAEALGELITASGPSPTHRVAARAGSNGSTARCSTSEPTPGPASARPNASRRSRSGCVPAITTAATPHSQASHQQAASPTCQGSTASQLARNPWLRGDPTPGTSTLRPATPPDRARCDRRASACARQPDRRRQDRASCTRPTR